MADTFEITGLNAIAFAAANRWRLSGTSKPTGMSDPLTREEVLREIRNLPRDVRGHALQYGLSKITFAFDIEGSTGADMEDALHDLLETLEDGRLYIETRGARGTKAQLHYKKDGAAADSYKTIFCADFDEGGARDVLATKQMEHWLIGMHLTLYCEQTWHPSSTTNLVNAATVYNHDDGDSGHDNYVDIAAANIKGDVEAKTKLSLKDLNSTERIKFSYVARRSQGTVASFDHWIEAETLSASNWASAADVDRSNGNIRSDSTNTSGNASMVISTNLNDHKGRLGIYAGVWTDDITNTKFRLSWQFGMPTPTYYSSWKWATKASTWQVLKLGQIIFDSHLYPDGDTLASWQIFIEYEKDATDTAKFDYVMLLPEDESAIMIEAPTGLDISEGRDTFEVDNIRDFPGAYIVHSTTGDSYAILAIRGSRLTLQPNATNRIYFKVFTTTGDADPFSDHIDEIDNDGAPAKRFSVTIDYLPQFISPLE